MTAIRKIIAGVTAFSALITLLFGVVALFSSDMIRETVSHSREIQRSFEQAAQFVEAFKRSNERLPSYSEFQSWASQQPEGVYTARYLHYGTTGFSAEAIERFGPPPPDAYAFSYWRGEWFEHYASWAKHSTLVFDPESYYVLGNHIADAVASFAVALVLIWATHRLWSRPTHRSSGRASSGAPLS